MDKNIISNSAIQLVAGIDDLIPEIISFRHKIHEHPETAFEEIITSELIAEKLRSYGLDVYQNIAKTGVIGVLKKGMGPSIVFRADMDALHISEENSFNYSSKVSGKMHACGHDGHSAMLMGAAKFLSTDSSISGTLIFIFQPAEENEGGARVMIEEGLFENFQIDAVYGLHNWPGLDVGKLAVTEGPLMAAFDTFELKIEGKGAHGAMPHDSVDPIFISAQVINGWQSITSRNVNPYDAAVVSVTQIHAGDTWNVIPGSCNLKGTTRSFSSSVRDLIEEKMRLIAETTCKSFGANATFTYQRRYPALINSFAESEIAKKAASKVVSFENVIQDPTPSMTAEDFAFMLEKKPGCYIWLGNGSSENGKNLHSPKYDFNDDILAIGISYWIELARSIMGPQ
jgi:hippurate hydrolase